MRTDSASENIDSYIFDYENSPIFNRSNLFRETLHLEKQTDISSNNLSRTRFEASAHRERVGAIINNVTGELFVRSGCAFIHAFGLFRKRLLVHVEIFTVPSLKTRVSKSHVGATMPQAHYILLTARFAEREGVNTKGLRAAYPRFVFSAEAGCE